MNPAVSEDLPPQPPEPLPDEACCGNGCDPCVLDTHREEVLHYRAALRAWQERQAVRAAPPGVAAAMPGD